MSRPTDQLIIIITSKATEHFFMAIVIFFYKENNALNKVAFSSRINDHTSLWNPVLRDPIGAPKCKFACPPCFFY
jgi:hypothetical protein